MKEELNKWVFKTATNSFMIRFSKTRGFLHLCKAKKTTRITKRVISLEVLIIFPFYINLDDKPTRERPPSRPQTSSFGGNAIGKENQRKVINIDESEDTFHN
jgi:hypothetical protein